MNPAFKVKSKAIKTKNVNKTVYNLRSKFLNYSYFFFRRALVKNWHNISIFLLIYTSCGLAFSCVPVSIGVQNSRLSFRYKTGKWKKMYWSKSERNYRYRNLIFSFGASVFHLRRKTSFLSSLTHLYCVF